MSEAEEVSTFSFDGDFQTKIAALMLRDQLFAQKTDGLISAAYFEREVDQILSNLALEHFKTYKTSPAKASLGTMLKDAFASKRIRKDMLEEVRGRVKELYDTDLSDAEFVSDQVAHFAREKAMEQAIIASVDAMGKRDYAKIEKMVRSALDVGVNDSETAYDYFGEIEGRTKNRLEIAAGITRPAGISTGFPDLDQYLYHKGWGRKELAILMAAAKGGKSLAMGDFAKNASMLGHNVIYVTLEVSARIIADRIDANIAETAMRVLNDTPHAVKAKIEAAEKKAGKFVIHEYPTGTLKVSGLRRLLERYRGKGTLFDLIVVDYGDILAPEHYNSSEIRENLRQIFVDLRAVAFDYNAAVLTATQTNREGAKASTAKMTDVAEDFSKIRTADIVISINATEEEVKSGECRLFFAAHRNGESGFTLRIAQNRASMKFISKVLGKE